MSTEFEIDALRACNGDSPREICARILDDVGSVTNMGDVALTLWAARLWRHSNASAALERLRQLDPARGAHETVEIAWALTALACSGDAAGWPAGDAGLAKRVAGRLMGLFHESSGGFQHVSSDASPSRARGHVCCFADLVYPTQALSYYGRMTGDASALDLARRCAEYMCRGQGAAGQWWWHFDVRTGDVVEGYPVYAVHQDAMGPMALFAAMDACGVDFSEAIARGVRWMTSAPELGGGSLIDREADIIWRKVGRHEPGKLSRGAQALASRVHPSLRVPGIGTLLRAGRIDYESRPYHMGWILHAFSPERMERWRVV